MTDDLKRTTTKERSDRVASGRLVHGTFGNGIPFVKFGAGAKIMLFLAGGPGNTVPSGFGASGFVRGMRAFTDEYTIVLVTRRSGLPEGYTTRDMANDYAVLIRDEFGGHVGLVMGVSFGGLIAQYFALDHPDMLSHLVIAMSGPVVSDTAARMDLRYAELIGQHKDRDAMASRADAAFTGLARPLAAGLLWLFGKSLLGKVDVTFRRDVVIEAQAEARHNSWDVLEQLKVPTLIVGSDGDFAFPPDVTTAMANRIPGAELKIYEGGHTAAFLDKRFAPNVKAFVDSPGQEGGRGPAASRRSPRALS